MSSAARVRACAALSRPWTYVTAPSLVVVAAFARRVCWAAGNDEPRTQTYTGWKDSHMPTRSLTPGATIHMLIVTKVIRWRSAYSKITVLHWRKT